MVPPTVDVVVPMYGAGATIAGTLASLRAQTFPGWRAIVVDDASRDDGPAVVARLAEREPRIELVRRPRNGGLAAARNTGLDRARAEFVHFLDADDWLLPSGLEALLATARLDPACAGAYGAYEVRDAGGAPLGPLGRTCPASAEVVGLDELLEHNRFACHAQLLRRAALAGLRFDEGLGVVEDYDLWLRLAAAGVRWRATEEAVAAYRVRPASLSKDTGRMLRAVNAVVNRAYDAAALHGHAMSGTAGCDVSDARRRRVLGRLALELCTQRALGAPADEAGQGGSIAMLRAARGEGAAPIGGEAAGVAAYWAVLLGLGTDPDLRAQDAGAWTGRLTGWWRALESAGLGEVGLSAGAARAYASLAVPPRAVAEAMLERAVREAAPGRCGAPLVVLGMGKNGRVLEAAARARGLEIEVRDDAPGRAGAGPSPPARADAPLPRGAAVLITPLEDRALLARAQALGARRVVRWATVRDDLAAPVAAALRGVPTTAGSGVIAPVA